MIQVESFEEFLESYGISITKFILMLDSDSSVHHIIQEAMTKNRASEIQISEGFTWIENNFFEESRTWADVDEEWYGLVDKNPDILFYKTSEKWHKDKRLYDDFKKNINLEFDKELL